MFKIVSKKLLTIFLWRNHMQINDDYNIILDTDSYKTPMFLQYPPESTNLFSYIESRFGKFDETMVYGYSYYMQKYLTQKITKEVIDEAEYEILSQGMIFNREGWEYIMNRYNGNLPLKIRAIPEGTLVNNQNALITIETKDEKCKWLGQYIETALLRGTWYPITVASYSYKILKDIIYPFACESMDDVSLYRFKLVDFGARGGSSYESVNLAGSAHLINFEASDTLSCHRMIRKYYNKTGFISSSVPASEHSTITSWGRLNELKAYRNMLKLFSDNNSPYKKPILACVSDSYDIINAIEHIWGEQLIGEIRSSDTIIAVRPDSFVPLAMVVMTLEKLGEKFGFTINSKGYKVLNNVRVVQGDGVNYESIKEICQYMKMAKWSLDNITFGMGGALHQKLTRDTFGFAQKCSAKEVNENNTKKWIPFNKDPITDTNKKSKGGKLDVYYDNVIKKFKTISGFSAESLGKKSALVDVYDEGLIYQNLRNYDTIRESVKKTLETV